MNSASFVGRLAPGFFAQRLGIVNVFMVTMGCGAIFILSMVALKTIASVVVIGVLYGLCVGVCAYPAVFFLFVVPCYLCVGVFAHR
jgi:predicted membrane-bound spermidine synthase